MSNHVSYLDPILLIALYPRQKTIVKPVFFKVPVFGQVLRRSGYISPLTENTFDPSMIRQIEHLGDYLARGGNLFVFPEGTRGRDGRIQPFSGGPSRSPAVAGPRCRWSLSGTPIASSAGQVPVHHLRAQYGPRERDRHHQPRRGPFRSGPHGAGAALMEAQCDVKDPAPAPSSTPYSEVI